MPSLAQNTDNKDCSRINQNLYDYITYPELVELSKSKDGNKELNKKVDFILNNAIVDNSISCNSNITLENNAKIGPFIRVAAWNIASPREAGNPSQLEDIKNIFTNPDLIIPKIKFKDKKTIEKVKSQMEILRHSNIIVFNEIDAGMPRTQYKREAEELAKTIGYNYVFVPEYLEVDPVHLGIEDYKWSKERSILKDGTVKSIEIDKSQYKGLHGTAILSQFPLQNIRILRLPQAYDWYYGEKRRISELEEVKRHVSEKFIKEYLLREIRVGSRIAVIADVMVPGLDKPITIVSIHLENRSVPKERKKEIQFILNYVKNIDNPVVLAGDFNTTCTDGSPTSIKKEIISKLKDPNVIIRTAILYGNHFGIVINPIISTTSLVRKYSNPTARNIPIISPNSERGLFDTIKSFKFSDGYTFDFRGVKGRSSNLKQGELADSNERSIVGYKSTFKLERPLLIGKYKLDWIFVKSYLTNPTDKKGSYKLAPLFGRTLYDMDYDLVTPPSDHTPITVDLPLQEVNQISKYKN